MIWDASKFMWRHYNVVPDSCVWSEPSLSSWMTSGAVLLVGSVLVSADWTINMRNWTSRSDSCSTEIWANEWTVLNKSQYLTDMQTINDTIIFTVHWTWHDLETGNPNRFKTLLQKHGCSDSRGTASGVCIVAFSNTKIKVNVLVIENRQFDCLVQATRNTTRKPGTTGPLWWETTGDAMEFLSHDVIMRLSRWVFKGAVSV